MPVSQTISEQIVQAIVTELKTIRRPTYSLSVDVQRVAVAGDPTVADNRDAVVQVVSRAPVRDYQSGFGDRAFYNMLVYVFVSLRASSRDTEAPDAGQARVLADITKIIEANRQWGGLAADSILASPKFGYDEAIPGADMVIDINFFCSASNPYSLS